MHYNTGKTKTWLFFVTKLWLAWCEDSVSSEVTKPRYGCPYPWPLSWLLPLRKQKEMRARLASNGWDSKNMQQVINNNNNTRIYNAHFSR
jgi:hypothetical protein